MAEESSALWANLTGHHCRCDREKIRLSTTTTNNKIDSPTSPMGINPRREGWRRQVPPVLIRRWRKSVYDFANA
ncbi:hypothetical protein M513_07458 [Trichuris suis]|uniref:Uncharacterized protein n=1 Tax=Trichuris suis TaxID=68888 RepID=A0A085M2Y3_9BILA|nr:hypothetical protein M513_07458 [Trichuris suis]